MSDRALEDRFWRLATRLTIAVALLAVGTVAALVALGFLIDRIDDTAASTERVDRIAHRAELNTIRLDKSVCAMQHYLERGLTVTAAPEQAVVHHELEILLGNLRPLSPNCPPAEPLKLP